MHATPWLPKPAIGSAPYVYALAWRGRQALRQLGDAVPSYYRPSEVDHLRGDASKARRVLGWTPRTTFTQLVDLMVDADIELLEDQLAGRLIATERD